MTHQVDVVTTTVDNLTSVTRTNMMEGKNKLLKVVLYLITHILFSTCVFLVETHTCTHKHKDKGNKCLKMSLKIERKENHVTIIFLIKIHKQCPF